LLGHDWEVTHEDGLFLDLTRVGVQETRTNEDRSRIRGRTLAALFNRELRRALKVRVVGIELEFELQVAREVRNRRNRRERVAKTGL
jgi:hypothetical protein